MQVPWVTEVECEEEQAGTCHPGAWLSAIGLGRVVVHGVPALPEGTRVRLHLTLPSLQMVVAAAVVRSMPGGGLGLRFRDLTPLQRAVIQVLSTPEAAAFRPPPAAPPGSTTPAPEGVEAQALAEPGAAGPEAVSAPAGDARSDAGAASAASSLDAVFPPLPPLPPSGESPPAEGGALAPGEGGSHAGPSEFPGGTRASSSGAAEEPQEAAPEEVETAVDAPVPADTEAPVDVETAAAVEATVEVETALPEHPVGGARSGAGTPDVTGESAGLPPLPPLPERPRAATSASPPPAPAPAAEEIPTRPASASAGEGTAPAPAAPGEALATESSDPTPAAARDPAPAPTALASEEAPASRQPETSEPSPAPKADAPAEGGETGPLPRVLVVDDHTRTRTMLRGMIEGRKREFAVAEACDGEDCLRVVREQPPFDLIFLDVDMPRLNGFETCKKLRALGVRSPIIFLTGRGEVDDFRAGREAGGDTYIRKPIVLGTLRSMLGLFTSGSLQRR